MNPHCQHCVDEKRENKICNSCETLKSLLDKTNYEREKLLQHIISPPIPVAVSNETPIVVPKNIPWNVRRQLLEQEDRAKARIMKDAPKPSVEINEIEKELGVINDSN